MNKQPRKFTSYKLAYVKEWKQAKDAGKLAKLKLTTPEEVKKTDVDQQIFEE